MPYTCPVCGFPALEESSRSPSGGGSYEICASCGLEFGYSDDSEGFTYVSLRKEWMEEGYEVARRLTSTSARLGPSGPTEIA